MYMFSINFIISIITFIFFTSYANAKDYNYKNIKLLFEENSNVYEVKYSNTHWSRTSKTISYFETNKSNELVSLFVGYHLPLLSNPRWYMDRMRDTILNSKKSPLSNKETFNFVKNTSARHLFIGEINIKKMAKNEMFNLNTLFSRANKKHGIILPDKLLSSIHVTISNRGIHFISYLTNADLKSNIDDWINLSLAREKNLSKTLNLTTLETDYKIKEDENYYFKKFKDSRVLIAKNNEEDNNQKNKNNIVKKEEKKKKELLAQKKAEEKKKKEDLLAQKKAEEQKKKEELLAQKKTDIQTEKDTTPPTIITAENVIVKSSSYKIIGILEDAGSDNLYIDIDGMTVEAKNGKFVIERFSPIDEKVKLVAIDQWGNKSEPVFVNVKVNKEKIIKTEKLEKLDPTKVSVATNKNKVALIFGIEKYNQTPSASYANKDAQYFYEYAKKVFGIPEQNIELLIDEKASLIESLGRVNKWLPAKIKKNKTDLIIFFAGHGLASPDGKDLYLLSQDSDPDLLSRTALSRSELFEAILKYDPKSVTMFFDTCFSGISRDEKTLLASARPVRVVADETVESLPKNFTIFSASQLDQISSGIKDAQHGIFSYFLMKGLEGNADINKDNKITNGELLSYMDDKISIQASTLGREQNPSLTGDPNKVLVSFN